MHVCMNLKEGGKGYKESLEGGKGRGKYYNIKNKIKILKGQQQISLDILKVLSMPTSTLPVTFCP